MVFFLDPGFSTHPGFNDTFPFKSKDRTLCMEK